ncbi:MAG: hypothetical protein Q4D08_04475 [Clostridia bacterium]|nr:hypothetical protein [Clostridia bacterium]
MTGPDRSPAAQARRTALLLLGGRALVLSAGQFSVERPLYDRLFLNWIPAFLGCGLLLSVLPRAVSGWQRMVCGGLLLLGALGGGAGAILHFAAGTVPPALVCLGLLSVPGALWLLLGWLKQSGCETLWAWRTAAILLLLPWLGSALWQITALTGYQPMLELVGPGFYAVLSALESASTWLRCGLGALLLPLLLPELVAFCQRSAAEECGGRL